MISLLRHLDNGRVTKTPVADPPVPGQAKPVFLYDDCCPMCQTYTASFSLLGWTDREAFSTAPAMATQHLDFDRARHHIPLVDVATGEVRYGLDGILGVVVANAPPLGPIVRNRAVRTALDGVYWFITYNRRHVISAPPPATGLDCAPDFNPNAVMAYLASAAAASVALAVAADAGTPVMVTALAAAALVSARRPAWAINSSQALGHVASVTVAAGLAAGAVAAVGGTSLMAGTAALAVGARKCWLRRWMVRPRR